MTEKRKNDLIGTIVLTIILAIPVFIFLGPVGLACMLLVAAIGLVRRK